MKRIVHSVFALLVVTLLSTSFAIAEQTPCVFPDQAGCFTIRVYAVKFDPQNALHKSMSDPEEGEEFFKKNLMDFLKYMRSPKSVSPASFDVYVALWTKKAIDEEYFSAHSFDGGNRRAQNAFENVTDEIELRVPIGKPNAIYRIRSPIIDGRGVSLVIPEDIVTSPGARVLVFINGTENVVFPHPAFNIVESAKEKYRWPHGYLYDGTYVRKILAEKSTGVSVAGLVIE